MIQQILRLMEQDLYEEAFQNIQLSKDKSKSTKTDFAYSKDKTSREYLLIEKILLIRTDFSNKNHFELGRTLNESDTQNPFIRGEIFLLKGLLCFEHQIMDEGTQFFAKAMNYFKKADSPQRELIAHYNYYVGQTHIHELSVYHSMSQLSALENKARICQNMKLLGLIIKNKSSIYKQLGKFQAALEEAKVSIPLLEFYGSKEDYNSSLVSASEIALELDQKAMAQSFLNEMNLPLGIRLEESCKNIKMKIEQK